MFCPSAGTGASPPPLSGGPRLGHHWQEHLHPLPWSLWTDYQARRGPSDTSPGISLCCQGGSVLSQPPPETALDAAAATGNGTPRSDLLRSRPVTLPCRSWKQKRRAVSRHKPMRRARSLGVNKPRVKKEIRISTDIYYY